MKIQSGLQHEPHIFFIILAFVLVDIGLIYLALSQKIMCIRTLFCVQDDASHLASFFVRYIYDTSDVTFITTSIRILVQFSIATKMHL